MPSIQQASWCLKSSCLFTWSHLFFYRYPTSIKLVYLLLLNMMEPFSQLAFLHPDLFAAVIILFPQIFSLWILPFKSTPTAANSTGFLSHWPQMYTPLSLSSLVPLDATTIQRLISTMPAVSTSLPVYQALFSTLHVLCISPDLFHKLYVLLLCLGIGIQDCH